MRATAVAVVGALITLAACNTDNITNLRGVRTVPINLEATTLDGQIIEINNTIYAPGVAANHIAWWNGIKRVLPTNPAKAKQSLVDLSGVINRSLSKITPLPGQTAAQSAAHLVLLMSLYVYVGPDTPPPELNSDSEPTSAIVQPTAPTTLQTESHEAAAIFPQGAVSQPTIIVVTRNSDEFPDECSGPLPTKHCQYPQFYKFDVFPDVKLNVPAHVAVCHVTTGHDHLPRADHDRFRIAHQRPADHTAWHPDGIIDGQIEILPLINVGTLTNCEESESHHQHGFIMPAGAGALERFALRARWETGRFASAVGSAVGKVLTPKSLYAIDRGGGGAVFMFSDFAVIDPLSIADLYPVSLGSGMTIGTTNVQPGARVTLTGFGYTNDGTGAAHPGFTTEVVLATNAALTEGVIHVERGPFIKALAPDKIVAGSITFVIPAGTAPGTYYLGIKLDDQHTVLEDDETNNSMSFVITVGGQ